MAEAALDRIAAELCILGGGCDYLASIKGVGFKTAIKLMLKLKDGKRVIRHLRQNKPKGVSVPPEYAERFRDVDIALLIRREDIVVEHCAYYYRIIVWGGRETA